MRTFHFSDLRDYTAFVEGQVDAAAADLLCSYREIVRARVAAHFGAEVSARECATLDRICREREESVRNPRPGGWKSAVW